MQGRFLPKCIWPDDARTGSDGSVDVLDVRVKDLTRKKNDDTSMLNMLVLGHSEIEARPADFARRVDLAAKQVISPRCVWHSVFHSSSSSSSRTDTLCQYSNPRERVTETKDHTKTNGVARWYPPADYPVFSYKVTPSLSPPDFNGSATFSSAHDASICQAIIRMLKAPLSNPDITKLSLRMKLAFIEKKKKQDKWRFKSRFGLSDNLFVRDPSDLIQTYDLTVFNPLHVIDSTKITEQTPDVIDSTKTTEQAPGDTAAILASLLHMYGPPSCRPTQRNDDFADHLPVGGRITWRGNADVNQNIYIFSSNLGGVTFAFADAARWFHAVLWMIVESEKARTTPEAAVADATPVLPDYIFVCFQETPCDGFSLQPQESFIGKAIRLTDETMYKCVDESIQTKMIRVTIKQLAACAFLFKRVEPDKEDITAVRATDRSEPKIQCETIANMTNISDVVVTVHPPKLKIPKAKYLFSVKFCNDTTPKDTLLCTSGHFLSLSALREYKDSFEKGILPKLEAQHAGETVAKT